MNDAALPVLTQLETPVYYPDHWATNVTALGSAFMPDNPQLACWIDGVSVPFVYHNGSALTCAAPGLANGMHTLQVSNSRLRVSNTLPFLVLGTQRTQSLARWSRGRGGEISDGSWMGGRDAHGICDDDRCFPPGAHARSGGSERH